MNKQIRSKDKVLEFGEVFTNPREVKAMLDLLNFEKKTSYDLGTTFLEPACGRGAFLIEILKRKLQRIIVVETHKKKILFNSLWALSTIYGIDKQEINVNESQKELLNELKGFYKKNKSIVFYKLNKKLILKILDFNIIVHDSSSEDELKKVVFSKYLWCFDKSNVIFKEFYLISSFINPKKLRKFTMKVFYER